MPPIGETIPFLTLLLVVGGSVLLLSGFLFHLRQDVAFVPSSMTVTNAMIDAANIRPDETVVDLGAGEGRFLIAVARRFPGTHVIGYEGAFWVYLLGRLRILLAGSSASIRYGDFFTTSLHDADVIFTYLSITAMKRLRPKFMTELKPGARVVSHAFSLPDVSPSDVRKVPTTFGSATIFVYRAPLTTVTTPTESRQ